MALKNDEEEQKLTEVSKLSVCFCRRRAITSWRAVRCDALQFISVHRHIFYKKPSSLCMQCRGISERVPAFILVGFLSCSFLLTIMVWNLFYFFFPANTEISKMSNHMCKNKVKWHNAERHGIYSFQSWLMLFQIKKTDNQIRTELC